MEEKWVGTYLELVAGPPAVAGLFVFYASWRRGIRYSSSTGGWTEKAIKECPE